MGTRTYICVLLLSVYLMNQIYSIESQITDQRLFRCKSGEYIKLTDYCDQSKDCVDGSDEPGQCKQENCGAEGKFLCDPSSKANFTCIPPKKICDTKKDCPDGSDEANCGDEVNVNYCQLSKGKFLCKDNLRCLDLEYTCDASCNCFDCSDESENCTRRNEQSLAQCSHSYFPTPSGLQCFCNSDDKTFASLCKEMKECPKKNPCDQKCSMYKNKMLCSCFDDYIEILVSNGFKCRSKEYYGTMMIYSTTTQIKSLNVTSKEVTVVTRNVQSKLLAASQGAIYYTTFQDDSKKIFLISSKKPIEVLKSNLSISSISIDYITGNFYFTTNQSLSVCTKTGNICFQLKCCDVNTRVAVAPKFGWMFYMKKSDVPNEQFIMKSNMDGSEENILMDGTLRSVTTMAVDESFARLYWIESSYRISSISLHDYSIERHYIQLGHIPESFKVLDEIFFYTVDQDNAIYQQENLERFVKSAADREGDEVTLRRYYEYTYDRRPSPSDSNHTVYKDTNATISVKNIAVYNPLRQKAKNPCNSGSCSGLCLLRPASGTSKDTLSFTCACKNQRYIAEQWCIDPISQSDSSKTEPLQSEDSFSFIEIFFILILLAAVVGGVYFLYQRYFSTAMYSRRSQPPSERIYDPNQSEIN